MTKYGKPRLPPETKCPQRFLEELGAHLQPKCTARGEQIVPEGNYGSDFVVLLSGKLRIRRPADLKRKRQGVAAFALDSEERDTSEDVWISVDDREPMIGASACLGDAEFEYVRQRTDHWAVDSMDWSDTLWVGRKAFKRVCAEYCAPHTLAKRLRVLSLTAERCLRRAEGSAGDGPAGVLPLQRRAAGRAVEGGP